MPVFTTELSVADGVKITGISATPSSIAVSTSVPANYNAILYGPITIASGVSLTVSANAKLKIKDFADA